MLPLSYLAIVRSTDDIVSDDGDTQLAYPSDRTVRPISRSREIMSISSLPLDML